MGEYMKNKMSLFKFEIFSTIFILVLGTLLHFTYEWSNNNWFVGTFSAVNESVWEHLKLLFFPMLITTIIGSLYFKDEYPTYLCSKAKGIILSLLFIVVFFYTYTGILGYNVALLDIGSFIAAVILGECYSYKNIVYQYSCNNLISGIILVLLTISFVLFTFFPPNIGLFEEWI